MLYEVKVMYTNGFGYRSIVDKECSVPVSDCSEEYAKQYMALLDAKGCKRHETATQIFYDDIIDNNHNTEYIFYK